MNPYEIISLGLEACVLLVLIVEYFFGRPDIVLRNEAKQRKRLRKQHDYDSLTTGESK